MRNSDVATIKTLPPDENLAHLLHIESDLPAEFLRAIAAGTPVAEIPSVRSIKAKQRAELQKAPVRIARAIERQAKLMVEAGKMPNLHDARSALLHAWKKGRALPSTASSRTQNRSRSRQSARAGKS